MSTPSNKHPSIQALKQLHKKLPGRVLVGLKDLEAASVDNLRISVIPEAVVKVAAEAEVGVVLKLANQYKIPVTARGAGSSATGSAVPVFKGWVLDLSRLKGIKLNSYSKIVTVGPGVTTDALQTKVAQSGLFYPPDPSSKKYSKLDIINSWKGYYRSKHDFQLPNLRLEVKSSLNNNTIINSSNFSQLISSPGYDTFLVHQSYLEDNR